MATIIIKLEVDGNLDDARDAIDQVLDQGTFQEDIEAIGEVEILSTVTEIACD